MFFAYGILTTVLELTSNARMFKLDKAVLINAVRSKLPNLKLIYLFGGEQHPEGDLDIEILPNKALGFIANLRTAAINK